jgi:hypothetical protein
MMVDTVLVMEGHPACHRREQKCLAAWVCLANSGGVVMYPLAAIVSILAETSTSPEMGLIGLQLISTMTDYQ